MAGEGDITVRFLLDDQSETKSDTPAQSEAKTGERVSVSGGEIPRPEPAAQGRSDMPKTIPAVQPNEEAPKPVEPKTTTTQPEAARSIPIESATPQPPEPEIATAAASQSAIPPIPVEPKKPETLPPIAGDDLEKIRQEYGPVAAEAVAASRPVIESPKQVATKSATRPTVDPTKQAATPDMPDVLPMTGQRRGSLARRQDAVQQNGEIQSVRIVGPNPLPVKVVGERHERPAMRDKPVADAPIIDKSTKEVSPTIPTPLLHPEQREVDQPIAMPTSSRDNGLMVWLNEDLGPIIEDSVREGFDETEYAQESLQLLQRIADSLGGSSGQPQQAIGAMAGGGKGRMAAAIAAGIGVAGRAGVAGVATNAIVELGPIVALGLARGIGALQRRTRRQQGRKTIMG